jgi:AcrR family transcriptional regulator
MSRAETAPRILEAAQALGAAEGVTALTLQGVATAAGVSKALVLYHFGGKDQLLTALAERVVEADARAVDAAASAPDPLEAWRQVAGDAALRASRALLAGLLQEPALRPHAVALAGPRTLAATRLASAMLRAAALRPRIATPLLGQVLLHQLDGVAVTPAAANAADLDAALDAAALAVLGLGR